MEGTYTLTDCELAELILDFQDVEEWDYSELVESINEYLKGRS